MDGLDPIILATTGAAVVAIVQLAKGTGLPDRWAGLAALVLGVALAPLFHIAGMGGGSAAAAIVAGLFSGLSAAGVYSGTRAAVKG